MRMSLSTGEAIETSSEGTLEQCQSAVQSALSTCEAPLLPSDVRLRLNKLEPLGKECERRRKALLAKQEAQRAAEEQQTPRFSLEEDRRNLAHTFGCADRG